MSEFPYFFNVKIIDMKREDKELLLRDLCARLPYGVRLQYKPIKEDDFDFQYNVCIRAIDSDGNIIPNKCGFKYSYSLETIKPYLRKMSSMTEEERQEYGLILCGELSINQFDWLNIHHFDYRGLIEKGLAIEVTKENNPYENNNQKTI